MTDQTLTIDQLLQSILNDIECNMPAALSPKVFFPVKEEPLSYIDDNKENIPPICKGTQSPTHISGKLPNPNSKYTLSM